LWQRNKYKSYAELNLELFRTVLKEKPDVMFSVQLNYEIWLETLTAIRNLSSIVTICWTTDDSWKYREVSRFIGKYYNVISTTYKDVIPLYRQDGIENVFLTQWAASSKTLQAPIPAKNCRYDVSFIGAAHGNRKQRIEKLRQFGIDVACFGYGWPNGPVKHEDISTIIQQSVISLNFANSNGRNQIKARNFEVPGAGGFLLAEYAPDLEKYYIIEKEIDIFRNTSELVRKIRNYIYHPEKRDQIAISGFERTQREHTYEIRLDKLLSHSLEHKSSKSVKTAKSSMDLLVAASKLHSQTTLCRIIRNIIISCCSLLFGKKKGIRAARRVVYEFSWRFFGQKTYTASGLPGRLFPEL